MLFQTPEFILFLGITLLIYYKFPNLRLYTLGFANLLFYGVVGLGAVILFLGIITISYLLSFGLQGKYKKIFIWIAILINVANLILFQYSILLLTSLEQLLAIELIIKNTLVTHLILPIGISFYTFQMIAYLVDVYQEKIEVCKSWLTFWVFMSFFGQLIAGPIMRGKDLIPQVQKLKTIVLDDANLKLGAGLFLLGLFKKVVLADNLAIYADLAFQHGASLTGPEAWIAAFVYTFQIYFDFSAYSEMALGIGYLFGIKLAVNFKTPYISRNPTEFWRRWHITLSTWIRDYIYIPLGGSRKGENRQYANLFMAMTISGLWHGAAWNFAIWGMYHGALLIGHKFYLKFLDKTSLKKFANNIWSKLISIAIFFPLVALGWVFFRQGDITVATQMINKMLTTNPLAVDSSLYKHILLILGLYFAHVLEYIAIKNQDKITQLWHKILPAPLRGIFYTIIIVIIVIFLKNETSAFIYFQF